MNKNKHEYMLLDRLKQDCEYFLGHGNRNIDNLWAKSVEGQIEEMKRLYNLLEKKPDWISLNDIERYELEMNK